MKLLFYIVLILSLAACSLMKRSVKENKSTTDSSYNKSTGSTAVVKERSNNNKQTVSTSRRRSDSGYSRTTVIKEYFSDEFDIDAPMANGTKTVTKSVRKEPLSPSSSPASDYFEGDPEPGKLKYRETTVAENGRIRQSTQKERVSEAVSGSQRSDSTVTNKNDEGNLNKSTETSDKQVSKRKLFPGWAIGAAIFVVLFAGYCYYKKTSPLKLWQTLTKRTK